MTTTENEVCNCEVFNCHVAEQNAAAEPEIDKETLCRNMCVNILQGLLEGYEGLLERNPTRTGEIQPKVQEIMEQIRKNHIKQELDGIFQKTIR
jgi:hypothetical protein